MVGFASYHKPKQPPEWKPPMTDIVERLRLKKKIETVEDLHALFADAAGEIERLREALQEIAASQPSDSEQAFKFKMLARAALEEKE